MITSAQPEVVTVTANTGIDLIYFIPSFEAGRTLRASSVIESMGGKPTDCSWILGEMGIPSLALGLAAGQTGESLKRMLHEKGVTTDFIPVEGESRRNLIIAPQDGTPHTAITSASLIVRDEHVAALRDRYIAALDGCELVVLGGTLPKGIKPEFYTDMIALARARNIPVIFDAGEPNLSAGLKSQPNTIKPNRDELSGLVGRPIVTVEDAYSAGREVLERYGTIPVISLGGDGGLVVTPDHAYRIPPLKVPVVNAAGAGDAVLAGLAAAVVRGLPIEDGLRLGFGAATAVVTTPGTAECSRAEIERYAAQIELLAYEPV
ncbi:MAG: 1-phosphofructokinase family hexose kinase [Chloroflexota bacterium]